MVDANLLTAKDSGTGFFTTLVKITALPDKGGDEVRVALYPEAIVFESDTYDPTHFTASQIVSPSGMQSDNGTVKHLFGADFSAKHLRGGKWAGAHFEVIQIDFRHPEWGALRRFPGRIGDSKSRGYETETDLRGLMDLLGQPVGDRTSKTCRYALGDSECGLNAVDWTYAGEVTAVTNRQRFEAVIALTAVPGVRGKYYSGNNFNTYINQRVDENINFSWPHGVVPIDEIHSRVYSVRWSNSTITFPATGTWTMTVVHKDGARLYIDDLVTPIIDQWATAGTHTGTFAATADTPYDFKLEMVRDPGTARRPDAEIILKWEKAAVPIVVVPASAFNTPGGTVEDHLFKHGRITWLTGENAGLSMETLDNDGDELTLFLPMLETVEVGDTFEILTGDDKTLRTCHNVFRNGVNFGGEPDMPTRETVFHIPE